MKFLKYIKENILKIKPIYKIKIVDGVIPDYYNIKFSCNNGWTWTYVLDSKIECNYSYGYNCYKVGIKEVYYTTVHSIYIVSIF